MEFKSPDTSINYERLSHTALTFPQSARFKPIYHYTSTYGFEGILKNRTLRFTNIRYMNDAHEVVAGVDGVLKNMGVSFEKMEEERNGYLSSLCGEDQDVFVCCFSLDGDSLPMWNYYTKDPRNQGYCVEFGIKNLIANILRCNPLLDGCDLSFGKVEYSANDESSYAATFNTAILEGMEMVFAQLGLWFAKGMVKKGMLPADSPIVEECQREVQRLSLGEKTEMPPLYSYNGNSCEIQHGAPLGCFFFVKRAFFQYEKEFRIVLSIPKKKLPELKEKGIYKFTVQNGILTPCIEVQFSNDNNSTDITKIIKSIGISPTVRSDLVELSVRDFVISCGFGVKDFGKFICHSKIPVRF